MTCRDAFTRFYLLAGRSGDSFDRAVRYACARSTRALVNGWSRR